jgi:uncharacterized HAD superfamily protein
MKRIAVDFDDVILPVTMTLMKFCSKELNKEIGIEELFSYKMKDQVGFCKNKMMTLHWDELHQNPPMEGCDAKLQELKNSGHELVILTAREYISKNTVNNYIEKYLPNIFKEIHLIGDSSKGKFCKDNDIHILIDDNLDNISEAEKHGVIGIPFGILPWTRRHTKHVPGWRDIQI